MMLRKISDHRSALMGGAILWIYCFHSGTVGNPVYDFFSRYGYAGVDIFLFLSAIGLCNSLRKNDNIRNFYKRRLIRIIPTWMTVLLMIHMSGIIINEIRPDSGFAYPHNLLQYLTWYSGLGYFFANIFHLASPLDWYYEWYVPTLLLFYAITPLLYKQKDITLIVLIKLSFLMGVVVHEVSPAANLNLCYYRLPVFILGILYFRLMNHSKAWDNKEFIVILASFLTAIALMLLRLKIDIPIFYVLCFLTPVICVALSYLCALKFLDKTLAFTGTLSFEIYLIHIYQRPLYLVNQFIHNEECSIVITFFLCFLIAWVLHKVMSSNFVVTLFAKITNN